MIYLDEVESEVQNNWTDINQIINLSRKINDFLKTMQTKEEKSKCLSNKAGKNVCTYMYGELQNL